MTDSDIFYPISRNSLLSNVITFVKSRERADTYLGKVEKNPISPKYSSYERSLIKLFVYL